MTTITSIARTAAPCWAGAGTARGRAYPDFTGEDENGYGRIVQQFVQQSLRGGRAAEVGDGGNELVLRVPAVYGQVVCGRADWGLPSLRGGRRGFGEVGAALAKVTREMLGGGKARS
jgi:hypothetical protein